jgi:hypothetical protein
MHIIKQQEQALNRKALQVKASAALIGGLLDRATEFRHRYWGPRPMARL